MAGATPTLLRVNAEEAAVRADTSILFVDICVRDLAARGRRYAQTRILCVHTSVRLHTRHHTCVCICVLK